MDCLAASTASWWLPPPCGGPHANEELNDASFGDDYQPVSSFWVRGFEASNNRRRMRSIQTAGRLRAAENCLRSASEPARFWRMPRHHGFSAARLRSLGGDLPQGRTGDRQRPCTAGRSPRCLRTPLRRDRDAPLLEHVADPIALLQAARARLKPGGTLQLAVPNAGAWEARLRGWTSYEPYHLLYFTPVTLRRAVERAGFNVVQVKTHESFSGWMLPISRTLLGYSASGARSPAAQRDDQAAGVDRASLSPGPGDGGA